MTVTTTDDLAARVSRGAELLDRLEPGWHRRIAMDRLAMESCDDCILGQLIGWYPTGYDSLRRRLPANFLFSASEHGFTLPDDEQDHAPEAFALFDTLADHWRREVRVRLVTEEER